MNICLITSQKKEELFVKMYWAIDPRYILSTYGEYNHLTIDNVYAIMDSVDKFIIGKTEECKDDFILELLSIIIKNHKKVMILHNFKSEKLNEIERLYSSSQNLVEYIVDDLDKKIILPDVHIPIVLINGGVSIIQKLIIACKLYEYFSSCDITCCILSSDIYAKYLNVDNKILLYESQFEELLVEFARKIQNNSDFDVLITIYPENFIDGSQNGLSSCRAFFDCIIHYYRVDYLITCISANTNYQQLETIDSFNSYIVGKKCDCFTCVGEIIDPFDYNVRKPNAILSVSNWNNKYFFKYNNSETDSIEHVVDDFFSKMKK